jgi:hypothetical protein
MSSTDVENDPLTYMIATDPSHGSLSGSGSEFVYTPILGFAGSDSFTYKSHDGLEYSNEATVTITVIPAIPVQVFWDDFEQDRGWVKNPFGSDTATSGLFTRARPSSVYYFGYKQLGNPVSGRYDLVTGPRSSWFNPGLDDVDSGVTSMRSPDITLPNGKTLTLSLSYYLAHLNNATSADYLRITVVGSSSLVVLYRSGSAMDVDAYWAKLETDISAFAGQSVYILIEAADNGSPSLVEAAVDDVLIMAN